MRKTLGVSLLVLLLTGSASAGEIPNLTPAPPPATANATQEPTSTDDATDSLTQTVLDLLAALPSLL